MKKTAATTTSLSVRAESGGEAGVVAPSRRGRPKVAGLADRRKDEIIAAATRFFARQGFDATDLQDIARELGLAKGTIYRYFTSKGALFQFAADKVMTTMNEVIAAAIRDERDPLGQAIKAVKAYLQFFQDNPDFVELLIHERAVFRDRKKPTYNKYREANSVRWQDMWSGLIKQGLVRNFPPHRITEVLGDMIYGAMFTSHVAKRKQTLVEQGDDMIDIVLHGLMVKGVQALDRSVQKWIGPPAAKRPGRTTGNGDLHADRRIGRTASTNQPDGGVVRRPRRRKEDA